MNNRGRSALLAGILLVGACSGSPEDPPSNPDSSIPAAPIRIGHPASPSFKGIAIEITNERLSQRGWDIESVFFTQTDLAAAALAQGTTQFLLMQPLDPLRVIERGVPLRWLVENNPGDFVLVVPVEAETCEDLEGLTVGISSKTSTNSMDTEAFLRQECGLDPELSYILEGEARVASLLADQVEMTFMQLADYVVLEREAAGRFRIFDTGDAYGNGGAGLWVNQAWVDNNRETARSYLIELLQTYRLMAEDPAAFQVAVLRFHPELDAPTAARMIEVYASLGGFPVNGGDASIVQAAISFFAPLGEISENLQAKSILDAELLEEALNTIGRIEGER